MKIRIQTETVSAEAELNATAAAVAIWEALPLDARANRWGDEIYFRVPVTDQGDKDRRTVMNIGELAFWPPGQAFCIFWGPTPASEGDEPRAASDVIPIGSLIGDSLILSNVADGEAIRLERCD